MRPQEALIISWSAAAPIWEVVDNTVFVFIQKSKTTDPKFVWQPEQRKFVGGKRQSGEEGKPTDRDMFATMVREVQEETFLTFKPHIEPPPLIFENFKRNDRDRTKFERHGFYLVPRSSLEGEMRKHKIVDGTSKLWAPRPVKFEKLKDLLYRTHVLALSAMERRFRLMGVM